MKIQAITIFFVILSLSTAYTRGQGNTWQWIGGTDTVNDGGSYGTQNVYADANRPPARYGAAAFTSNTAPMYIFGGLTTGNDRLNDLWQFDGSAWTWIGGSNQRNNNGNYGTKKVGSSNNLPSARYQAASWTTFNGAGSPTFWVFGGQGIYGNLLNDLWSFDGQKWMWVSGAAVPNQPGTYTDPSSLTPGSRYGSTSFVTADDHLWLFGGSGFSSGANGILNDLWEFDGQQWYWQSGSSGVSTVGKYGNQGSASTSNCPGSRMSASGASANGILYVFGGTGLGKTSYGMLNDLWAYSNGQWTWLAGSTETDTSGSYGTLGVASYNNSPPPRMSSIMWISNGQIWIFGGTTYSSSYNDLWMFNGQKWAWMAGSSSTNQPSIHGAKYQASSTYSPGARAGPSGVMNGGWLYLFGGSGLASSQNQNGLLNDVWRFGSGSGSVTTGTTTDDATTDIVGSSTTDVASTTEATFSAGSTTDSSASGAGVSATGSLDSSSTQGSTDVRGSTGAPSSTDTSESTTDVGIISGSTSGTILGPGNQIADPSSSQQDVFSQYKVYIIASGAGLVGIILFTLLGLFLIRQRRRRSASMDNIRHEEEAVTPFKNNSIQMSPLTLARKRMAALSPSANRASYTPIGTESSYSNASWSAVDFIAKPDTRLNVHYNDLKFLHKVGKGSFGKVFVGEWERITVAIKICSTVSIESMNEFLGEAKLMMNMRPHPFVVQLLGVSTDGPHPAMILEYCSLGSLDKLVYSNTPLDQMTIDKIIYGIALGTLHLHKNKIVHRDIATRNILLSDAMTPKLADFGLSRFLKHDEVQTTNNNALPIRWMSPESLKNRSYSTKSDVWSWAVLVSEVINREEPYKGYDLLEAALQIRDEGLVPTITGPIQPYLSNLLHRCWNQDPALRPSMEEVCDILRDNTGLQL